MSISYKKINAMIAKEVMLVEGMSDETRRVLKEVCEQIYVTESSLEQISAQQIIADIRAVISSKSEEYKRN